MAYAVHPKYLIHHHMYVSSFIKIGILFIGQITAYFFKQKQERFQYY